MNVGTAIDNASEDTINTINDLLKLVDSDNINMADTIRYMKNQLLFKNKEKAVIEKHGGNFNPITIHKNGKEVTVYKTKHQGKAIQAKSYEDFIEKVAIAYGIVLDGDLDGNKLTVNQIFNLAIKEKEETENNNDNTIQKGTYDYRRYIDDSFQEMPISQISEVYLKAYTQKLTRTHTLKKKSFYAYKGVLNLIFNYAIYHKIIEDNPVKAIKNSVYLKSCDNSKPKNTEKILSEEEINMVKAEVNSKLNQKRYKGYCVNGYVVKLAIETGMRVGELCSLKESDILDNCIHIHTQQLSLSKNKKNLEYVISNGFPYSINKGKICYEVPWTKDEKGISQGGRMFPLTPEIRNILIANKEAKKKLGLKCEYAFCTIDDVWIKSDAYETFLRRMMTSLNLDVTNNHAFRMSLNSNVFIPKGLDVGDRAALLGHSIETNLKHYSFSRKDSIGRIASVLAGDSYNDTEPDEHFCEVTPGHLGVIPFRPKEKSLQTANLKAFH